MKKKRIRAFLFGVQALSYANVEDIPGNILDLGEGDNPYGLESSLFARVDLMKPALWASYPHTLPGIKEDLIRWWSDTCPLSSENLFLTAGSIRRKGGCLVVHRSFPKRRHTRRRWAFLCRRFVCVRKKGFGYRWRCCVKT